MLERASRARYFYFLNFTFISVGFNQFAGLISHRCLNHDADSTWHLKAVQNKARTAVVQASIAASVHFVTCPGDRSAFIRQRDGRHFAHAAPFSLFLKIVIKIKRGAN